MERRDGWRRTGWRRLDVEELQHQVDFEPRAGLARVIAAVYPSSSCSLGWQL